MGPLERPDTRRIWEANAAAWIELSRAGYDVNREVPSTRRPSSHSLPGSEFQGLFGLDLGCGEGHNTRLLVRKAPRSSRSTDDVMLIAAAAAESRHGIRYVLGDGAILPFGEASFDFVTGFMSLMDVADPETTLREVARVSEARRIRAVL